MRNLWLSSKLLILGTFIDANQNGYQNKPYTGYKR